MKIQRSIKLQFYIASPQYWTLPLQWFQSPIKVNESGDLWASLQVQAVSMQKGNANIKILPATSIVFGKDLSLSGINPGCATQASQADGSERKAGINPVQAHREQFTSISLNLFFMWSSEMNMWLLPFVFINPINIAVLAPSHYDTLLKTLPLKRELLTGFFTMVLWLFFPSLCRTVTLFFFHKKKRSTNPICNLENTYICE